MLVVTLGQHSPEARSGIVLGQELDVFSSWHLFSLLCVIYVVFQVRKRLRIIYLYPPSWNFRRSLSSPDFRFAEL